MQSGSMDNAQLGFGTKSTGVCIKVNGTLAQSQWDFGENSTGVCATCSPCVEQAQGERRRVRRDEDDAVLLWRVTRMSVRMLISLTMSHSKAALRLLARDRHIPALRGKIGTRNGDRAIPFKQNRLSV